MAGAGVAFVNNAVAQEATVMITAEPAGLVSVRAGTLVYKGTVAGTMTATVFAVTGTVAGGSFTPRPVNATGMFFVTLRGLASCSIGGGCDAFGFENASSESRRRAILLTMDLGALSMFAASGADLNENEQEDGVVLVLDDSILFALVTAHLFARVSILAAAGADINVREEDNELEAFLHDRIRRDDLAAVTLLIAAGADVNLQDESGDTPLDEAILENHAGAITALVAANGECNTQSGDSRCTADPPIAGDDGNHPNLTFVVRGSGLTVEGIVILAADLFAADAPGEGATVIYRTATPDVAGVNADNYITYKSTVVGTVTATVFAVTGTVAGGVFTPAETNATGSVFVTLRGLASCSFFNGCDAFGFSDGPNIGKHIGVLVSMSLRTLSMFAASGADMNEHVLTPVPTTRDYLIHPLITAIRPAHVSVLIAAGADINVKSFSGNTFLHDAANSGQVRAVTLLIAAGASLNARGDNDNTPLLYAAANGRTAVIMALLSAGADINAQNDGGHTPLDRAIQENQAGAIAALTAANGRCNTESGNSHCP